MLGASPITTWEGAAAFYTYADGGAGFWVLVCAVLCIVPLWVALRAENAAHEKHN